MYDIQKYNVHVHCTFVLCVYNAVVTTMKNDNQNDVPHMYACACMTCTACMRFTLHSELRPYSS